MTKKIKPVRETKYRNKRHADKRRADAKRFWNKLPKIEQQLKNREHYLIRKCESGEIVKRNPRLDPILSRRNLLPPCNWKT